MGRNKDGLALEKLIESWDSIFPELKAFLLNIGLPDIGTDAFSYIEGDVFVFRISECYEYVEFYQKHSPHLMESLYGDYIAEEEEATLTMLVNAIKIELLGQKRREKLQLTKEKL